jgi:hypothetical protein
MEIERCHFDTGAGHGVTYESSTGWVRDCRFRRFSSAAVAVFGTSAAPLIRDCKIKDCGGVGIAARGGCRPVFANVSVRGTRSHGISISDSSDAYVCHCEFSAIGRVPVCIFNDATAKFVLNRIEASAGRVLQLLTGGSAEFHRTLFLTPGANPPGIRPRPLELAPVGVFEESWVADSADGPYFPVWASAHALVFTRDTDPAPLPPSVSPGRVPPDAALECTRDERLGFRPTWRGSGP